eukprot:306608-Amphidinium_carterae.1
MENGFGQTVIQVDNEPAILQHAQEVAEELTILWRHSSSHSHHRDKEQWNGFTKPTLHNAEPSDIKPFTVNKLAIRNNEEKVEPIWLRKTTNSGEHIAVIAEQQWNKEICDNIDIPQMDNTMDADYVEEGHIGKSIIELWVNNKEVSHDNNQGQEQKEHITTDDTITTRLGHSIRKNSNHILIDFVYRLRQPQQRQVELLLAFRRQ